LQARWIYYHKESHFFSDIPARLSISLSKPTGMSPWWGFGICNLCVSRRK